MAVSVITAQYNPQRRFRKVSSTVTSASVAGVNPIDTSDVELKNLRGKVTVTISATDDPLGTFTSFVVNGGHGQFPDDPTWNWYVDIFSVEWCTVSQTVPNVIVVTTTAPLVVREYTFTFNPRLQYPPKVTRSGGVLLGAANVSFTLEKIM